MIDADPLAAGLATREPGFTLVTATQRLAGQLAAAWDRRAIARGCSAWARPDVAPWSAWTSRCVSEISLAAGERHLGLSSAQELQVWEQVIAHVPPADPLVNPRSVAATAQEAWQLMHAWQLGASAFSGRLSEDVRSFARWAHEFEQRCRDRGWLDSSRFADRVIRAVEYEGYRPGARLLISGFDEFTPQQAALCAALRSAQVKVRPWMPRARAGTAVRLQLENAEEEIRAAALWARAVLERSPRARIGVVVPDMGRQRAVVERIFEDALEPGVVRAGASGQHRAFNMSLGRRLSEYPLVDAALGLLRLLRGNLPLEELGLLLRSPHLAGGTSEWMQRAVIDAGLRRSREPSISLGDLRLAAGAAPVLDARLARLEDLAARLGARQQSPAQWAKAFAQVLGAAGWPGERDLDSTEVQLLAAWSKLLGELAGHEIVLERCGLAQALDLLVRMASQSVFQPRSSDAPVQVLGVLEAAGMVFDQLWVCGLHAEAWPVAPRPNPLLPVELQRRLEMPHSSASRELRYANWLTGRLLQSAGHVVMSYPRMEEDRAMQVSPLIAHLRESRQADPDGREFRSYFTLLGYARQLEQLAPDPAPPLARSASAAGGSSVIRLQAQCPFRAFAELRLGARPVDEPQTGLDAAERGQLVHEALARLWRGLRNRDSLLGLDRTQRLAAAAAAVAGVLEHWRRKRPHTFTRKFTDLEQGRLERLLLQSMEIDAARPPFEVREVEETREAEFEGVRMKLRIDREDVLPDGRVVIIDYKTGNPEPSDWFAERPQEPQMPLYCVAEEARHPAALVYVRVAAGECKYSGVSEDENLVPGAKPVSAIRAARHLADWSGAMQHWRGVVTGLVREFASGRAVVQPYKGANTCRNCALPALCRVNELGVVAAQFVDDEEGDD